MPTAVGSKIVTTENYIASYVGAKILEKGGNAFDAAIAISATLSVVMPYASGLGGDGLLLAKTPEGIIAYNATGWAPKNLKAEKISERDPNSVVVPGLVDLWYFLEDYITLSYEELLSPAISLAINGFYTSRSLHHAIINSPKLSDEWSSVFGNKRFGDFIRLRKLGNILREVSRDPRNFYEGKIPQELTEKLQKNYGVPIQYEDFSEFHGEKVNLVKIRYHDFEVYEFPPNTQGITTLQILKMVEIGKINKLPYNDIRRVNDHIRISTIAYEDRNNYIADPRFVKIPDHLLNENYLSKRMFDEGIPINIRDGDTTFFAVSDGENDVGFIQSLYYPFGSGIVVDEVVFNNRGYGFTEGNNKPEGRKRPRHTLSILYAERNNENLIIGCAGADLRPQIHSEVFEYYTDYMMEIDEAVNAPRFMYLGNKVIAEKRLGIPATQEDYYSRSVGIVQALKRSKGRAIGVADPRSEGIVLPVR